MIRRLRYAFAAGFMLLSILTVSIWGVRVLLGILKLLVLLEILRKEVWRVTSPPA